MVNSGCNNNNTLDKAQEYYNNKNYNKAIDLLDTLIQKEPQNYQAIRLRGLSCYQTWDILMGVHDLSIVIAHDSADTMAMSEAGELCTGLNFSRSALFYFNKIIILYPHNIKALNRVAQMYLTLNKPDSALIFADKALSIDSSCSDSYYYKGAAYSLLGDDIKTIKYYNLSIRYDDKSSMAYYERGMAYKRLDSTTQAIFNFDTAIDLSPSDTDAYLERGIVLNHLNRNKEACSDWTNAEANGSNRAKHYMDEYCK